MKKLISMVLAVCIMASLCAACGMDRSGSDAVMETPIISPDLLPDVSPMVSPDMDDGVVNDNDGVIGDEDDRDTNDAETSVDTEPTATPDTSTRP